MVPGGHCLLGPRVVDEADFMVLRPGVVLPRYLGSNVLPTGANSDRAVAVSLYRGQGTLCPYLRGTEFTGLSGSTCREFAPISQEHVKPLHLNYFYRPVLGRRPTRRIPHSGPRLWRVPIDLHTDYCFMITEWILDMCVLCTSSCLAVCVPGLPAARSGILLVGSCMSACM